MKVKELLSEGMTGYKPRYDDEQKVMFGAVSDWLEKMGVTKADVAKAVDGIKKDPLMKELSDAGLEYIAKPASEKNGTLTFKVKRNYPAMQFNVNKRDWVKLADKVNTYDTLYQVYANGQIRSSGISNREGGPVAAGQTRLQSPKPRLKAGDPVGSLTMIYQASLKEVLRKWEKAKASMAKQIKAAQKDGYNPDTLAFLNRQALNDKAKAKTYK